MAFVKDNLMKCSINEACQMVTDLAKEYAKNEVDLFCRIMGYPKNEHNDFIGGDPHGVVAIQEDYMFFNMTDIHVVLKEYERWLKIYGDNKGIRKAVEQWYYYCQEWYNQHSSEGCPNLRSWLAGCPVEGLRDATLEWQTQRERDLQAAHQRVEEAKQALEDAIKEEVKLNN